MDNFIMGFAGILGITLLYAAPLIYTAMGGVVSENTGVVNIGLEGMMTIGAVVGATVGYYVGNPWIAFLCAGLGGMGIALLHGIATIHFGADHVVSGTALNLLGPGLAIFLARMFFDGAAMTKPIPLKNKMPRVLSNVFPAGSAPDIIFGQYITVYIAFIVVALVYFILYKTKLGLRIRSVGEHPHAAETLGVDVYKIKYIGVLTSGFLAGLGGASLSLAVQFPGNPDLRSRLYRFGGGDFRRMETPHYPFGLPLVRRGGRSGHLPGLHVLDGGAGFVEHASLCDYHVRHGRLCRRSPGPQRQRDSLQAE